MIDQPLLVKPIISKGAFLRLKKLLERVFILAQTTLVELIGGKKDVVAEYLANRPALQVITRQKRIKAEVIFKDGERRIFPCRAETREKAVAEVLHFVDCMERQTGQSIVWSLLGEKEYYIGSSHPVKKKQSIGSKLFDYFFGLED